MGDSSGWLPIIAAIGATTIGVISTVTRQPAPSTSTMLPGGYVVGTGTASTVQSTNQNTGLIVIAVAVVAILLLARK